MTTSADAASESGYADVNGVHLYYEIYGSGSPLVLLHGGMLTIELNFATLIPTLARSHQVIGVELQGHGRTADTRMPTQQDFADMNEAYLRLSPHPEHFDEFLTTLSTSSADLVGWSDEQLAGITAPVLLVIGDRDFTTVAHGGVMLELIPEAQLAVLPGTTHMQVTRRADLVLPMLSTFLA